MKRSRFPLRTRGLRAALATAVVALTVAAVPAIASAEYGNYCKELVPAHTDCAINPGHSWDYWNGVFSQNYAYYSGSGTVNVCEHTYDRGNGATVSDNCANNSAEAGNQLVYYYEHGIELSGHAGNNSENTHTINGTVVF